MTFGTSTTPTPKPDSPKPTDGRIEFVTTSPDGRKVAVTLEWRYLD